ncbi:alpha/beta hydrolase, partial [Nonomuraea sp. SBT364]|uniref:alpha/beta hydrolase n=1 Tax=Nonomuraea sp. SBT364 TaxID=1580530 RepID=UPI0018CCA1C5
MSDVLVLIGPGAAVDEALLGEIAEGEFTALGVRGVITYARDAAAVRARTVRRRAASERAVVIIPGADEGIRGLMREPLGLVVWLDIWRADGVEVGDGATHIHGRGLGGLSWAIRHAVHRLRHPRRRIPYGDHQDQWGELHLPPPSPEAAGPPPEAAGPSPAGGEDGPLAAGGEAGASAAGSAAGLPVVVLVHGGYWRSVWGADLMEGLCADLVGNGFAVWNLEYRRPDLHGWDATTADVAAGMDALAGVDAPLDLDRVAVAGHSAGAQLALRAVADGARVRVAVSLAGVLDLVEGGRRWIGQGAVADALGGLN